MSNYIIDVTEADFQYGVLQYSRQKPVVVDFWAEWCQPCRVLGPLLENLAEEAKGRFRLAKVDVDENPNLALRYNVRSIPNVKGFLSGEVASEFVGILPEAKIRQFLRELAPSSTDLTLEKASSMLDSQNWSNAETNYRKVLANSNSPAALLGLAKTLLAQNKATEAKEILVKFPASREYASAEKLLPLAHVLALITKDFNSTDSTEATFQRALMLVQKGNFPAALDGLLEVLRRDKNYRDGEVRHILIAIFEILGDDSDLTRQYRQEMATILF